MDAIIEVRHLTKRYGRTRGVVDLTFEVREGEVFGFLGPNGSGKTTTIRVLIGLLRPTAGTARIAGLDCWRQSTQTHHFIGYLPGEYSFDPGLTGAQILQYLANLRGGVAQENIRRLVERFELDPSQRYREYSHGNKQKVGLIQAFMHRPRLLILDEPTIGLDPLNQQEFYALIREVRDEGRTVFLSSHNLAEVEHTCDRVGIIREGRLADLDTVANLKEIKSHSMDLSFPEPTPPEVFASLPGVLDATAEHGGQELHLMVQGEVGAVIRAAADHGATNIATHEPTLEEIFLHLYSKPPAPEAAPA
jgi:ABC-2 type transport system ATP-binding protein